MRYKAGLSAAAVSFCSDGSVLAVSYTADGQAYDASNVISANNQRQGATVYACVSSHDALYEYCCSAKKRHWCDGSIVCFIHDVAVSPFIFDKRAQCTYATSDRQPIFLCQRRVLTSPLHPPPPPGLQQQGWLPCGLWTRQHFCLPYCLLGHRWSDRQRRRQCRCTPWVS